MIHIFGGGTFSHVRNHLALATPAFGETARKIQDIIWRKDKNTKYFMHLTKMASAFSTIVTNEDVEKKLDDLIANPETKVIFFNVALCDYEGSIGEWNEELADDEFCTTPSGKYEPRLKTSEGPRVMQITPAAKLIGKIRKERKDIFVVGFKTTCGASSDEQYITALNMLKANSINLVLANDTKTRNNMIVAPEETRYFETKDRQLVLEKLVEMTMARASNTFTRSTVVEGEHVFWGDDSIPDNLRKVVDHCISRGAYKAFRGATAGHFAVKISDNEILTSKRKTNYNDLMDTGGLVRVEYEGLDKVIAHGFKPSVGGQSQRIIFDTHKDVECIVHAHVPLRPEFVNGPIPIVSQFPNECGSHQCGLATSNSLKEIEPGIKVVMLDNHGPNVCFSKNTDPQKVVDIIEKYFDLSSKTGGLITSQ